MPPIQISLKKTDTDPTSAAGLTLAEPIFNVTNNTLWVGKGTGNSPVWIGSPVTGASGAINSGLVGYLPTTSAVKDYVLSVTPFNYVSSWNGLTGAVNYSPPLATSSVTGVASFGSGFLISATGSVSLTGVARLNTFNIFTQDQQIRKSDAKFTLFDTGAGSDTRILEITPWQIHLQDADAGWEQYVSLPTGSNENYTVVGDSLSNTFTARNNFSAGLSAANILIVGGATFNSSISAPNIVNSVNSITGQVNIVAGNNISITADTENPNSLIVSVSASLLGPQGVQGATGATGPQGVQGATGATGPQGVTGPVGDYVISVNGLTGVVTNIAQTTGATFTGRVAFNAGLTTSNLWVTSGATFNSGIYVTGGNVVANSANIGSINSDSIILGPSEEINTYIYNDRIEWHNENASNIYTLLGHTGSNNTATLPAVGGLLVSNTTTNPFLNIQTFNAGISASGASFSGNISAPNIVNSIAGLTGAVGITAGTNITVSVTGNNIQISSSASSGVTPAFVIAMSIAL